MHTSSRRGYIGYVPGGGMKRKNMTELVVLVDDNNTEIGTADKRAVHTADTPLHRGFSLFVLNTRGDVLLTRRADSKRTFPGIWTNTVCGHPAPGESAVDAAKRRLRDELGITHVEVSEVSSYRYRFADKNGIVEHEICPILTAVCDDDPTPNPSETGAWKWIPWKEFFQDVHVHPDRYSPWSREEAELLVRKKLLPINPE